MNVSPSFCFTLIFMNAINIIVSSQTKPVMGNNNIDCIETEIQALLSFEHGLVDEYNKLSSWGSEDEKDCCNWKGVKCNNDSGHVVTLDLHDYHLKGKIDSSLINLTQLTYLDLSLNSFDYVPIPEHIGSLTNLNYLNLSFSHFGGIIPSHIGNLSKLSILDLQRNYNLVVNDFGWISNLLSLKHLDLSSAIFYDGTSDWANTINKLTLLENLFLVGCYLSPPMLLSHSYTNFSRFLSHLDLSGNNLNSSIYPWLFNFSHSLVHLDLAFNGLQGPIPHEFKNMASLSTLNLSHNGFEGLIPDGLFKKMVSLSYLDLSYNRFEGLIPDGIFKNTASLAYIDLSYNRLEGLIPSDIGNLTSLTYLDLTFNKFVLESPTSFHNLCDLKSLFLSFNNIGGLISDFFNILPQCTPNNSLQYLILASNQFHGLLPNFSIKMFSSLKGLDLSNNTLKGTIPQSLGQLSNLEYLILGQNSMEGEVSEAHFSNLSKLHYLNLSGNSLILNFKSDWVPPFQLDYILLRSCKLGPRFPRWLATQNFSFLDISHSQIADTIPYWFWNNLSADLLFLDLSGNKINGEIPNLTKVFKYIDALILNSNEFVGQIPPFLFGSLFLDLSNNKFSGGIFSCEISHHLIYVSFLDLSNNQLSGQLSNCWDQMSNLRFLSLSNNSFSGDIPRSMGTLSQLEYLHLRNNQFSGEWPCWFNFTQLRVFDAMGNNLSGTLPSCIGSQFPKLVRLNLKSNNFRGNLPSSLCNLTNIQVLDISSNSISGSLPTCINKFKALTQRSNADETHYWKLDFGTYSESWFPLRFSFFYSEDMIVIWKGTEHVIKGSIVLPFVKSIDLSDNYLNGKIPDEITELIDLINLNLSRNNLTGQIPDKINQFHSLESLDLSRNLLFGPIPSTLSQIFTLSKLDLSYNNLSGKVPDGTQLQTFNAYSYEGNFYLCGALLKKCSEEPQDPIINPILMENKVEDGFMMREFFISMSVGFVAGFWGIFGSLILHRKWRQVCFKFMSNVIEKLTWKWNELKQIKKFRPLNKKTSEFSRRSKK